MCIRMKNDVVEARAISISVYLKINLCATACCINSSILKLLRPSFSAILKLLLIPYFVLIAHSQNKNITLYFSLTFSLYVQSWIPIYWNIINRGILSLSVWKDVLERIITVNLHLIVILFYHLLTLYCTIMYVKFHYSISKNERLWIKVRFYEHDCACNFYSYLYKIYKWRLKRIKNREFDCI